MIVLYDRPGSFSDRWATYCRNNEVAVKFVDLFASSIIKDIQKIKPDGFLCHPELLDRRSQFSAKNIIEALHASGLNVFPTPQDFWHYDDKIAQKYFFESLQFPTPKTWVFFDEVEAIAWLQTAKFPLVFKLRCGAGSSNVQLVSNLPVAVSLSKQMFRRGMSPGNNLFKDFGTKVHKHRQHQDWGATLMRLPSTVRRWATITATLPRERAYVYFQEFIPNNPYDTRVTVIGERAFAFRRMIRPDDFRASGSGRIDYDPEKIDLRCIDLAFACSRKMRASCMAYDIIYDLENKPLVVEASYAFNADAVYSCPGHWKSDGTWRLGQVFPQDAILTDFLNRSGF